MSCAPHGPDNNQPSMDAHAESELNAFLVLQTGIQVSHGIEHTEPSTYGSLGVIFMRLGIAKVDQQAISKELGDVPIVALDNCGTNLLICMHHVPVLFGIELGGEFRGVH